MNAAHVLDRADRGRLARRGFAADVVLLDAPDWRHLAYHLAGDVVHTVIESGRSRSPRGHNRPVATQKQRRRRAKEKRHDYDLVEIDEEGNETVLRASELRAREPRRSRRGSKRRADEASVERESRRRASAAAAVVAARVKRGAMFAPIFLATVLLLGGNKMTFAGAVVQTVLLLARLRAVQLLHGPPRLAAAPEAPRSGRSSRTRHGRSSAAGGLASG